MEPCAETNDEPLTAKQCAHGSLRTDNLWATGSGRKRHLSQLVQEGGLGFERPVPR